MAILIQMKSADQRNLKGSRVRNTMATMLGNTFSWQAESGGFTAGECMT